MTSIGEGRREVVIQRGQAGEREAAPAHALPDHSPILPVRPTTSVAINPLMRVHMMLMWTHAWAFGTTMAIPHAQRGRFGERERATRALPATAQMTKGMFCQEMLRTDVDGDVGRVRSGQRGRGGVDGRCWGAIRRRCTPWCLRGGPCSLGLGVGGGDAKRLLREIAAAGRGMNPLEVGDLTLGGVLVHVGSQFEWRLQRKSMEVRRYR